MLDSVLGGLSGPGGNGPIGLARNTAPPPTVRQPLGSSLLGALPRQQPQPPARPAALLARQTPSGPSYQPPSVLGPPDKVQAFQRGQVPLARPLAPAPAAPAPAPAPQNRFARPGADVEVLPPPGGLQQSRSPFPTPASTLPAPAPAAQPPPAAAAAAGAAAGAGAAVTPAFNLKGYLGEMKAALSIQEYKRFAEILRSYQAKTRDTLSVIDDVASLLTGSGSAHHLDLLRRFRSCIPSKDRCVFDQRTEKWLVGAAAFREEVERSCH